MENEKMFYNAVAIACEGNPSSMRKIREKCGTLFAPWKIAYEIIDHHGPNPPDPELEWKKLERLGIQLIFREENDFPPLLREMHNPPLALYVLGELPRKDSLSIVGTRRATREGKSTAKQFACELARVGFVIVSGLALGIDAAAHEGCLEANGRTVAVLAGGLEHFYPGENEKLGKKILASGGAIVSEYPLGEPPYPDRFLERNRIVCGFSKGVLIVECPKRSGSLATAAYAVEQNRDLFVVPGSINHSNFFGSHELIRQGAELVTKPEDILNAYHLLPKDNASKIASASNDEERLVLIALDSANEAPDVDKIIEMTKLEPRIVSQTLSFLLIKNLIRETEGGYIIE